MRGVAIIIALSGCGDVPAADLDGDGIRDTEDVCPSGFADDAIDADGDGKDATQDLCPHDRNAIAGDRDEDGIPDACDPFFDEVRLDTRRCVTSFGVRWVNAAYLHNRAGELPFDLQPPLSARATETVSAVSAFPLAFPTASFDVLGEARFDTDAASFQLWLRATALPSKHDVACGVDAAGLFLLADGGRAVTRPITLPPLGTPFGFRIRASVGGTNATVLCRLTVGGETATAVFDTELLDGGWGVASSQAALRIDSVVIDSNDTAVPYRNHFD